MPSAVDALHHRSAQLVRSRLAEGGVAPAVFREALQRVPAVDRDAWLDLVLELDGVPEDDPSLPPGCVPYLPCPVDTLLRVVDHAEVGAADVFVDVGAGVGRAAALVQLLTGAAAVGVEIQPALVEAARQLAGRLKAERLAPVHGDATRVAGQIAHGSVFFLYCPFSGERLEQLLDQLEPIARTRPIRLCCVDLPLPSRPWLELAATPAENLQIYRSRL